ncbi:TPA: hypothetical protein ACOEBP_001451 [Enterobacter ludwigii]
MSRPSRYRNHRSPWTLRELNFVKKHYDSMPTAEIADWLGRPQETIKWMTGTRGVFSARSQTAEEERILAAEYLALGVAVAGQLPGRTQDAVKLKACDMDSFALW